MIGREDRVSQEWLPDTVELWTLAIVGKLASEYSLDMLGLLGQQVALPAGEVDFNEVGAFGSCP